MGSWTEESASVESKPEPCFVPSEDGMWQEQEETRFVWSQVMSCRGRATRKKVRRLAGSIHYHEDAIMSAHEVH